MQANRVSPPQISAAATYDAYVEWSAAKALGQGPAAHAAAVQVVLDRFGWSGAATIEIRLPDRRWLSATLRQAIESLAPLHLARCLREPIREVQELLRRSVYLQHTAFLVRLDHDRRPQEARAVDDAAEEIAANLELEGLPHDRLHDASPNECGILTEADSAGKADWPHWNGSAWVDIDLSKLPGLAAIRKAEG